MCPLSVQGGSREESGSARELLGVQGRPILDGPDGKFFNCVAVPNRISTGLCNLPNCAEAKQRGLVLETDGPSLNSDFTTWSRTKYSIALSFNIHLAGLF